MFPSVDRGRDAVVQVIAEHEAPAAGTGEAGAPEKSFNALVNGLLGALPPADTAPAGGGAVARAEIRLADDAADLEAIVSSLPVPPLVEALPPDGKTLPPTVREPGVNAGDDAPPLATEIPAFVAPPALEVSVSLPMPALAPDPAGTSANVTTDPVAADAVDMAPASLPHGAGTQLSPDAPRPAFASIVTTAVSSPPAAPVSGPPAATPPALAPAEAAAVEAAAIRLDTPARTEQAPQSRTEPPLPPLADEGAARFGDAQGQARVQELLATFGASDNAARAPGEPFRILGQGADGGAPGNAAALSYAQTGAAGPGREAAAPSMTVYAPLRHPEWSDEVSQRIRWAIGHQAQFAELKINPPQLGPIEVRVSVDPDRQMTVTLSAQHALVRETLQESLPRLRELMSEHGFSAVNVDVSQHPPSDGRKQSAQAETDPAARAHAEAGADVEADSGVVRQRETRGFVDLYA